MYTTSSPFPMNPTRQSKSDLTFRTIDGVTFDVQSSEAKPKVHLDFLVCDPDFNDDDVYRTALARGLDSFKSRLAHPSGVSIIKSIVFPFVTTDSTALPALADLGSISLVEQAARSVFGYRLPTKNLHTTPDFALDQSKSFDYTKVYQGYSTETQSVQLTGYVVLSNRPKNITELIIEAELFKKAAHSVNCTSPFVAIWINLNKPDITESHVYL